MPPNLVNIVAAIRDFSGCGLFAQHSADQVEYGPVVGTIVGGQVNGCRQIVALQDRPGDLIEAVKPIIERQDNTFFRQCICRQSRQAFRQSYDPESTIHESLQSLDEEFDADKQATVPALLAICCD